MTKQLLPLFLTIITFLGVSFLLFCLISLLNNFPLQSKIILQLRIADILVGITIYLKTSVDFAIFIGNTMSKYLGIKNRIAIEIGTALGNATGTFFVLCIWTFFKEVPLLMICMILLASFVLFSMAEEGLTEYAASNTRYLMIKNGASYIKSFLHKINNASYPIIHFIIPHAKSDASLKKTFFALLFFSFTIPLILGLDDFAGYIPLFNIVNVFGFGIGVFLGHMILNIALFAFPNRTIQIVRQPFIALLGSIAFVGIAAWGFVEVIKIAQTLF